MRLYGAKSPVEASSLSRKNNKVKAKALRKRARQAGKKEARQESV